MSRFSNLEFDPEFTPRHSLEGTGDTTDVAGEAAVHLRAAEEAFHSGDFEKALRAYARTLEHNPDLTHAWTGHVRMLIELGEFREAKLWADKALERFPHDPELLAAKAVALGRLGDFKAAMAFSDAAFEERGEAAYVWLARADVLLAHKQSKAEHCLDRARLLDPANWVVHWLISRIQFYHQRFIHALQAAQQALALEASRFHLWLQVAHCQYQLGLLDAAGEATDRALELNPRDPAARELAAALANDSLRDRWRGLWQRLFSS